MGTVPNDGLASANGPETRESIQRRFFKMGAVVALGELLHEEDLLGSETQKRNLKRYLKSFGVSSIEDVERLGINGIYKYSFERLYR
ncbi:MAG: hypothetical protein ACI4B9_04945 [Eggerthellaceae bacterium]